MESQLASILLATLSPDASTRRQAENELESVLANPDAGTAFASIALAEQADPSLRQISGVMLKKFMDKWWDVLGENNGLSEQQKSSLLPLLFSGLSLPSSKLRSQFAFSLSIPLLNPPASAEGGVLPQLLNLLAQGTQDQVHGAMRVFKEVVRKGELDLGEVAAGAGGGGGAGGNNGADERVLAVVRGLGPVLLGVLGNEAHSASTRSSSIAVFRQCLYTLFMLKDQLPTLANDTVGQVLPSWLDAFVVLLGRGDLTLEIRDGGREGWEGLLIKKEIFKTLDTIFRSFPRTLPSSLLVNLLPLIVNHLTSLLPFHSLYSLSSTSDVSPPSATEPDGEEITIEQVVCPIVDFLTEITRAGRLVKGWTEGKEGAMMESMALSEVVGAVLGFTMMTVEEEENFSNDPNAFVLEEDDETDLYSLRVAGHDFISTLLEKYPQPTARVLHTAVQWRIGASEIERTTEDPDWWKGLEASLACVGGVSEVLLEILEEEETQGGKKSFDLGFLFDEVIPKFLAAQDLPFLQGRSFVVASQYATALAPALAAQYLDAAVQVLEAPGMSVSVKISAVKTIKNFCRHLPPTTVKPLSHRILSTLVPLITQAGEEVLALVLESLRAVVGVDEDALEPTLMGQLADVLLDVWAKNVKDMIISSIFEELFEHLASTPSTRAYTTLMSHSLPKLCSAISSATAPSSSEDPVAAAVLAAGAIEVVSSLLRGRTGPIDPSGEGYVAGLGTVLFPSLLEGEDMEMVQNGSQALTLLIRKDCHALLQSSDPATGRSGLDSVFGVIARLLRPNQSESRGLFLGDLVVHLLRNAGQAVASVLPELIKAMVQRIPTATYATFQQSLIVPLAYLLHTQFDATLSLLETTPIELPNSSTVSALEVLLKSWAENAETFQGSWAIRVSTLALADLFASERPSLSAVGVRGEMIQDASTAGVIMTRSMTKSRPIVFSSIPFPLKALKLILVETKSSKASDDYNTSWDLDDDDDDEDDEGDDGDWADDGPSLTKSKPVDEFGFLSDMMGGADEEGFDNEDEDLKNDPVSNIDMHAHLSHLLKTSYARMDGFGALVGQLNEEERGVLGSILA